MAWSLAVICHNRPGRPAIMKYCSVCYWCESSWTVSYHQLLPSSGIALTRKEIICKRLSIFPLQEHIEPFSPRSCWLLDVSHNLIGFIISTTISLISNELICHFSHNLIYHMSLLWNMKHLCTGELVMTLLWAFRWHNPTYFLWCYFWWRKKYFSTLDSASPVLIFLMYIC